MKIKICSKCKRKLEVTNFGKNHCTKDKLQTWCNKCRSQGHKEDIRKKNMKNGFIIKEIIIPKEGMKICSICKRELTIDNFGKCKRTKAGLRYDCKECHRKSSKEYRTANKDKIKESSKQYREKNHDKLITHARKYYEDNVEYKADYAKKYRAENPEKISIRGKKYHNENKFKISIYRVKYKEENIEKIRVQRMKYSKDNKDKIAIYGKQYSKENKDKLAISSQKHRAKKALLPCTLTAEEWNETKNFFNNKCAYCGKNDIPLQREHLLSFKRGGGFTAKNIIPACQHCNSSKGNKLFDAWYSSYEFYSQQREAFILGTYNTGL